MTFVNTAYATIGGKLETVKIVDSWRLHPVSGDGLCIVVKKGGETVFRSTVIVSTNGQYVRTTTGSIYCLEPKRMDAGMWAVGLEMRRPKEIGNLRKNGFIGV